MVVRPALLLCLRGSVGLGLVLIGLHLLGACASAPGGSGPNLSVECIEQSECATDVDSLRACVDGKCQDVACLSTTHCPLGQVCDLAEQSYTCVEGCQSNFDCQPGEGCDEGTCVDYGCRSTVLDCPLGEFCNEKTGDCEAAAQPFCDSCDVMENVWDDRGTVTDCDDLIGSHPTCGEGSMCWDTAGTGDARCYMPCTYRSDCPAGFQCVFLDRLTPPGCDDLWVSLGSYCVADCP